MLQWTLGKDCVICYNAIAGYVRVSICNTEITMHKTGSVFAKDFAKGAQMFYFGEPEIIGKAEVTGLGKNEARVPWLQGRKKLGDAIEGIRGYLLAAYRKMEDAGKLKHNSELKLYFHQGEHVLRHCAAGLYRNA